LAAGEIIVNWDAIGAVAELLGALGVIISLIYLAVQIRQNTQSVRMTSHHGIADQFTQTTLATVHDRDLAALVIRGVADADSLGETERARFFTFLMAILRTYEEIYQLDQRGLIDSKFWKARNRSMRNWLANPDVRSWWSSGNWSDMFVDSFRMAIDQEIENLDSTYL
jgi:hypothetical protein